MSLLLAAVGLARYGRGMAGAAAREAFGRVAADPGCQEVSRLRTQALPEALLRPTGSW
jgi:hypothetical protein